MKKLIKPLRGGQITIPTVFRKQLKITRDTVLEAQVKKGKLEIIPMELQEKSAGSAWAKELYALFTPVRKSLTNLHEKEINKSIDEALLKVRERDA